jgi:putative pre-16S rRNA nuclease
VAEPAAPETAAPKGPASGAPRVVLAFDFGLRRIGVACGDTVSRSAAPLDAVPVGVGGPRWEVIEALLREWQPALIVVGLPYNVDGSDSVMTQAAREFANEAARRYKLQVALVDERYSSREAEARLKSARASGLRRRRVAKADVDAAAACVILERWFTEET